MLADNDWPAGVPVALWAKLDNKAREGSAAISSHPLLCHMVDVAVVTHQLWEAVLPGATKRRVAAALGMDERAAGLWISFCGGAHDIGKACPPFQLRKETPPALAAALVSAGLVAPRSGANAPHGVVTTRVLWEALPRDFGLSQEAADMLGTAVGGHHGVFPDRDTVTKLGVSVLGNSTWAAVRQALLDSLASLLDLPRDQSPLPLDNAAGMWLAGLVSVADWIGSNTDYFDYALPDPAAPPPDLADYLVEAHDKARSALRRLGWSGWTPIGGVLSFHGLFPTLPELAPVQQAVVDLAGKDSGPVLAIVEAPMGEGKTEAAMYLADYWTMARGQRGCFFALPTQATSNQMFGRVRDFLAHRYPQDMVNLQLLHGHAALSQEFALLRANADQLFTPRGIYDDTPEASKRPSVVAAEWFTYRKRGLLAPFGVGTVDQLLLGVLRTRHVFVRLFALAGKTVIVDEVHAYDTYMSQLLERLLTWLGALGCSVVLLSATLPTGKRAVLLEAYLRGVGRGGAPPEPAAAYPRITWAAPAGPKTPAVFSRHVPASPRSSKTINLRVIPGDPVELGRLLGNELTEGGCAAVVCNTVDRAQKVYVALKEVFSDRDKDDLPTELDLLHARYPFKERERREQRALWRFGKEGEQVTVDGQTAVVERPRRRVLVATQIIEQSLDLDFDLMVTDLAPIDLLLQRSGRLHRHERGDQRPPGLRHRVPLWVCRPLEDEHDVPLFARQTRRVVYDGHVQLRSWWELRRLLGDGTAEEGVLRVPDDVEALIEAVYDQRPCPADMLPAWREAWARTLEAQHKEAAEAKQEAKQRLLPIPDRDGGLDWLVGMPREEDAPDLHPAHQALTRLAEPSVSLVLLHGSPKAPSLKRAGGAPFDPATAPTMALTKELLRCSVSVSDRRLVGPLLRATEATPPAWQRSALLRHHRAVYLDDAGDAQVAGWTLRLDSDLGLCVLPGQSGATQTEEEAL